MTLENCLFFTISPLKLQSRYKWQQQVNIGILNRPPPPQNMVCSTPFSFWAFLISSLNLSVVLLARSSFVFMSAISAWIFTRPFLIAIEVAFFFSCEKLLLYIFYEFMEGCFITLHDTFSSSLEVLFPTSKSVSCLWAPMVSCLVVVRRGCKVVVMFWSGEVWVKQECTWMYWVGSWNMISS